MSRSPGGLGPAAAATPFTAAHVSRSSRRLAPISLAAALALAYLIVAPTGADLPAQLLRVRLFGAEGFGIWNNWWYGGHYLPGYSVLFPPLAWLTTPQLVAAAAGVVTAWAFELLLHDVYGEESWIAATWLGAATVTELLSGRLTFALGLCATAATALLLERRRRIGCSASAGAALLATLASPVAGLFAAVAGATVATGGLAGRSRRDVATGLSVMSLALGPVAGLALLFPQGGSEPFALGALWPVLAAGVLILALAPGRVIATATVIYLGLCIVAYLVTSPVGSNAARLGELLAGPIVALVLAPRRAWLLLALCALPLTYLQIHDAIADLSKGQQAPADTAAYYRPLVRFLDSRPGAATHAWRVEVPATAGHWEAYRLAADLPLARGWERQLDIADDGLFYGGRLTAPRYEGWLHRLAVRYVAVADAAPDYSAGGELALIRRGLPYLTVVQRLRHWTVYAVADPTPIATGAGRVVAMGPDSVTVRVTHPGSILVRVRWSPYWELSGVSGCVARAGSFTRITVPGPLRPRGGREARLLIGFSLGRIHAVSPRCT